MRAGKLRDRITLEEPVEEIDALSAPTQTWTDYATVWANVEPSAGREVFIADKVEAEITHRVSMRYFSGVTPKMRISFKDRTLEILSVVDSGERNRNLDLMCREVV